MRYVRITRHNAPLPCLLVCTRPLLMGKQILVRCPLSRNKQLYERSLRLESFKTLGGGITGAELDLFGPVGTTYKLTPESQVILIDPYADYLAILKKCFDFDRLKKFLTDRPDFSILFDGMHGAGGPFARKVLVDELGISEVGFCEEGGSRPSLLSVTFAPNPRASFPFGFQASLMRCNPLPDFGQGHPDPNLTYAAALVKKMGLLSDGSADPSVDLSKVPTLGAANDGDGDRNLIAGAGCFVTPSDSLAIICDNWESIPHFARAGGPKGVARSMPSSAALDVVAKARNIPCFSTPTGWKFFGNLMSSKELFGKRDYTPFLCGEESFGTGSDHIREKDGLWAALAWMSILMEANASADAKAPLVTVRDVVEKHWAKYGRHFYCRYDYEGVDSDDANSVMDLIRKDLVLGDLAPFSGNGSIQLVKAEEFSYTDPVDGSVASKQGLILSFRYANGDEARVVFRLSGTGSAGATVRVYLEKFEPDTAKHGESAPSALKSLAERALEIVKMKELTGRDSPTVIT
jgi:phosphoglucomutase